jgi:NAD-specific glutamate dehydrogenase
VFENLGLKVISEDSFPVSFTRDGGWRQEAAILDFAMERADGLPAKLEEVRSGPRGVTASKISDVKCSDVE